MLTILTVPKPFRGRTGDIQRNAIESWRALRPDVQVVLVGDEKGVEQAARDAGVQRVGRLALNDHGTPRLDSAFERTATVARWPLWCLVNADVVLLDDFREAVERMTSTLSEFLLIGECRDIDVTAGGRLSDAAVRSQLRKRALERGRLRGYAALDYFVFPQGLFDPVPPFVIGRACFDNWMVWRARERGCPVVDATRSIVAVHQSHDYSHVPGGLEEAYYGEEARQNEQLAGGREHIYSLHDATHRLYAKGRPIPYWGSKFRARERARVARVRMDIWIETRQARKKEHRPVQRPVRVLGVFPRPRTETTPLLDALARAGDIDLTVLYAAKAPVADEASAQPLRHVNWFPRSVHVSGIDRVLGRDYPINWAIWNSFHGLKPYCMIISGWSTFATQAAIAWCVARQVPYLLLVDEHSRSSSADSDGGLQHVLVGAIARRAAGVLVTGRATQSAMLEHGVRSESIRELPEATDAAAAHLLHLVRSLSGERSSGGGRVTRAPRLPNLARLRPSVTRRAQRRQSRSASPGRRG